MLLFALLFLVAVATHLTDSERYTALTTSLAALEANPTQGNLAKIQLILKSTDYMTLQAAHAPPAAKKRFKL